MAGPELGWISDWARVEIMPMNSTNSAPLIYRYSFAVIRAKDSPVAVGLAADYDHFDFVPREHMDQLVRRRRQHRSVRLLAVCRARIDVVLDQLIVPVLTGRHARVVVDTDD